MRRQCHRAHGTHGFPNTAGGQRTRQCQIHPAPGSEPAVSIQAEVVEVEAQRRFAFTWLNGPLSEPTTVTVTLDPVGDGSVTRLRLAHTDPSGKSRQAGTRVLGRQWGQRLFTEALPNYLARKR